MGIISELGSNIVIASQNIIYIFDKRESKTTALKLPPIINSENKKHEDNEDGVVCITADENNKYIAAATKSKRLIVWDATTCSIFKEKKLVKQAMAIVFVPKSSKIIIADKAGDVYEALLNERNKKDVSQIENLHIDEEPEPKPLLGHLSMLLDLAITNNGKYLITSDRDEKIRVSKYPNCYNIHTFCLGHTEFISQIKLLPNSMDRLLSASGDGKIKLWNHLEGRCYVTLDVKKDFEALMKRRLLMERGQLDRLDAIMNESFVSVLRVDSRSSREYLVGVYFHRLPFIVLYQLDEGCEEKIRLFGSCETTFPVHDFVFLSDGEILVFLDVMEDDSNHQRNPFVMFEIAENSSCLRQVEKHPILVFGEEHRDELTVKNPPWNVDGDTLFKHNKFDNVAHYQQKKMLRINSGGPVKRKSSEL